MKFKIKCIIIYSEDLNTEFVRYSNGKLGHRIWMPSKNIPSPNAIWLPYQVLDSV